jgi:ParB family chromosome partitioning protein
MVQSIKDHGVITPLIVRQLEDGRLEILSGHNRANAAKMANLIKIPIVIKEELTDEEAMLIVTETNLIQRSFSELSHSEKARILTERHNAIKEQGKRVDLINEIEMLSNTYKIHENSTSDQVGHQVKSRDKIGDKYDLSGTTIARYLRIDSLTKELKQRVDKNEIPFTAAVDLSFLNKNHQEIVETILEDYSYKIDLKKSEVLKNYAQARNLNYDKAKEVLSGKYFNRPKKVKNFKLKSKLVNKFFKEDQTQKEVEEIIEIALELYFSQEAEENKEEF